MAATPPAPVTVDPSRRFRFATTDPDEAQEFIGRTYRAQLPRTGHWDATAPVSLSQVGAAGLSVVDVALPPRLTLSSLSTDDVSVTTHRHGGTHVDLKTGVERYRAGDVCLGSFPRGDYLVRCVALRATVVTIPAAAIRHVLGELPDQPRPPLRFDSLRPRSPSAAATWERTAALARGVLDDDLAAASPLVTGHTARVLAATALTLFPPTDLPDPTAHLGRDGRDAHPDTLRRAIRFVDDNAHTDITVADIAAAAAVTARAVQFAFARHLDTTPTAYLRRVRLERTHRDLLAADPTRDTVTAVAARWGFFHAGRFATAYRQEFGRPPSHTLRRTG